MSRLPPLTPDKIIIILKKSGYLLDRIKGSHHIFIHPDTNRRVVVPVHQGREIPTGTVMEIIKQAGITREELQRYLTDYS